MLDRGTQIVVNGKTIDLLLSTEALAVITEKWGGIDKVGDAIDDSDYAAKIRLLPELLAVLANAAEEAKDSEEVISAKWIRTHSTPGDFKEWYTAIREAFQKGMAIELPHVEPITDVDVVLAEQEKNGQSAAGN